MIIGDKGVTGGKVRNSSWLTELPVMVRGMLRQDLVRQDDGTRNILRIKPKPVFGKPKNLIPPQNNFISDEVCVPVTAASFNYIPFDSPLVLGEEYTFQAGYTPLATATTPISYEFKLNGVTQQIGASADWLYTLVDGDIHDKDGGGLGVISVEVVVRNACNVTGSSDSEDIPAQGTP